MQKLRYHVQVKGASIWPAQRNTGLEFCTGLHLGPNVKSVDPRSKQPRVHCLGKDGGGGTQVGTWVVFRMQSSSHKVNHWSLPATASTKWGLQAQPGVVSFCRPSWCGCTSVTFWFKGDKNTWACLICHQPIRVFMGGAKRRMQPRCFQPSSVIKMDNPLEKLAGLLTTRSKSSAKLENFSVVVWCLKVVISRCEETRRKDKTDWHDWWLIPTSFFWSVRLSQE